MNRKILLITFAALVLIFTLQFFYIPVSMYDGKLRDQLTSPSKDEVWKDISSVVNTKFDKLQKVSTREDIFEDRYEIAIMANNIDSESIKVNISHSVAYVEAQILEKTNSSSFSYSFSRSFRIDEIYDSTKPKIENLNDGFKIIFYHK